MAARTRSSRARGGARPLALLLAALLVALIALAAWRAAPLALWAYNIQRAGALLERALAWPEPREADALPALADRGAAEAALGHLAAAARWRPAHPYAHLLAGRAYVALGDPRSAESYGRAAALAPDDPLVAWERSLLYEREHLAVRAAPMAPLTFTLALLSEIRSPANPISTPFCQPGAPSSCYVAYTGATLPVAGAPTEESPHRISLFTHPPVTVRAAIQLPEEASAFTFLHGLMPEGVEGGSDGARFELWVEPEGAPAERLYERELSGEEAAEGWHPGWVDLSPWAGERVTLVLVTGPGPADDYDADWYLWGEPALRPVEAARRYAEQPAARAAALWEAPPIEMNPFLFLQRAERAVEAGDLARAAPWFERAAMAGLGINSGHRMAQRAGYEAAGEAGLARAALESAALAEVGWQDGAQRAEALAAWGVAALGEGRRPEELQALFRFALSRDADAQLWEALVGFWRDAGDAPRAAELCAAAEAQGQGEMAAPVCATE